MDINTDPLADDRIDSRDLLAWLEEYDSLGDDERDDDMHEIAKAIADLRDDTDPDGWEWGVFFIAERDFVDYARELADDIGAVDMNAGWPTRCIDWQQAADELAQDYSATTIYGSTYYYREA